MEAGRECDFIVAPHGKKPGCFQVCWELTADNEEREIQGLLQALEFFDVDEGVILTFNTEDCIPGEREDDTGGSGLGVSLRMLSLLLCQRCW